MEMDEGRGNKTHIVLSRRWLEAVAAIGDAEARRAAVDQWATKRLGSARQVARRCRTSVRVHFPGAEQERRVPWDKRGRGTERGGSGHASAGGVGAVEREQRSAMEEVVAHIILADYIYGENRLAALALCHATPTFVRTRLIALRSGAFSRLLHLTLQGVSEIPPAIGGLRHLKHLAATHGTIEHIPPEIAKCEHLTQLVLSHNRIEILPRWACGRALVRLHLAYNPLRWVSPAISACPHLSDIDLRCTAEEADTVLSLPLCDTFPRVDVAHFPRWLWQSRFRLGRRRTAPEVPAWARKAPVHVAAWVRFAHASPHWTIEGHAEASEREQECAKTILLCAHADTLLSALPHELLHLLLPLCMAPPQLYYHKTTSDGTRVAHPLQSCYCGQHPVHGSELCELRAFQSSLRGTMTRWREEYSQSIEWRVVQQRQASLRAAASS
eukprot:TRINITY_DN12280_c0_g1_i1.p1 TRINITY_DN12280_c0_g1~~TRINITY_DN12280_c0_g1_i1.p1  ORF type:complete len:441 (-),score=61.47 TRINITY_DN12280_c0_g1_i1:251-1573(-)